MLSVRSNVALPLRVLFDRFTRIEAIVALLRWLTSFNVSELR